LLSAVAGGSDRTMRFTSGPCVSGARAISPPGSPHAGTFEPQATAQPSRRKPRSGACTAQGQNHKTHRGFHAPIGETADARILTHSCATYKCAPHLQVRGVGRWKPLCKGPLLRTRPLPMRRLRRIPWFKAGSCLTAPDQDVLASEIAPAMRGRHDGVPDRVYFMPVPRERVRRRRFRGPTDVSRDRGGRRRLLGAPAGDVANGA
jgi:hypothetical protein